MSTPEDSDIKTTDYTTHSNAEKTSREPSEKKDVSLVLGSGGARGLAHIGVIHELEANGYNIRSICGCSMGAVIGGIYAAGKLDEYEQWVRAITRLDILKFLDLSWASNGFVKGDKIINTLVELVGDKKIEDLPIKFTAVAADISNHREVWINSGSLFKAIRASISLPLFFTPVRGNKVLFIMVYIEFFIFIFDGFQYIVGNSRFCIAIKFQVEVTNSSNNL